MIKKIILSKKDSINFISSLIKPSINEIKIHNNQINKINNNIVINYNDNGFEATIVDLDLSFLDNLSRRVDR